MSVLHRLGIQGIRSFGAEDCDRGVVEFYTPVTLILGPNGTGKTTIIESLKYISTGELPPGAKKDAAFIHDPKLTREYEVKAKIALQFSDVSGQLVTASRQLIGIQLTKKVEMKTIDSVISRKNKNGEKVSLSNKCAEMDREMVALLGISKAVLENVIFCHQEDSNWPLGEGKQLKQKFDDLFASTRYVKALDAIRKCKLSQNSVLSEYKIELKYLNEKKGNEARVKCNLNQYESDFDKITDRMLSVKEELAPVKVKLIKLSSESEKITNISTKIEVLKTKIKEIEKNKTQLRQTIGKELMNVEMDDLKQQLENFNDKLTEQKLTMNKQMQSLEEKKAKLANIEAGMEEIQTTLNRHKHDAEAHQKLVNNRDREITRLASKFRIDEDLLYDNSADLGGEGGGDGTTTAPADRFIHAMAENISQISEQLSDCKESFTTEDALLQKRIDKIRKQLASHETVLKITNKRIQEVTSEMRQLDSNIMKVNKSIDEVDDVKAAIVEAEDKLSRIHEEFDENLIREEIDASEMKHAELERSRDKLDTLMSSLSMNASAHSLVNNYKRELTTKQDQYDQIICTSEDDISSLIGSCRTDEMTANIEKTARKITIKLNECRSKLKLQSKKLITLETEKKSHAKTIDSKQTELDNNKDQINKATGNKEYNNYVVKQKKKLDDLQSQVGYLEGTEKVFIRYKRQLQEDMDDAACPLCQRCFDSKSEIVQLIEDIDTRLNLIPENKKKAVKDMTESRNCVEQLLQLKRVHDSVAKLEDNEIPSLESKQSQLCGDITKLKSNVSTLESDVSRLEKDQEKLHSLRPECNSLVRLQKEIDSLQTQITKESSKFSKDIDDSRTIEDVTQDKKQISKQIEKSAKSIHKLNKQSRDTVQQVNALQTRVNQLNQKRLEAEEGLQKRLQMDEKRATLVKSTEEDRDELKASEDMIIPLKKEVEKLIERKGEESKLNEVQVKKLHDKKASVNEEKAVFVNIQKEVAKFDDDSNKTSITACSDRLVVFKEKHASRAKRITDISESLDDLKLALNSQTSEKRNIEDNILLLVQSEDVIRSNGEVALLVEELGGLDCTSFVNQRQKLERKYSALKEESNRSEEKLNSLERSIKESKEQLTGDLSEAAKKYNDKMIDIKTTEIAKTDLDKYYIALDRTIMHFHKQKMDTINKIIRELWVKTYKGNDIEAIEVRFDEGDTEMKARKVYNYRVVMIKQNGIELDMRGRCSTGQKVLASLIIRLALAETFCIHCGIMALDEPTTNLDRNNIESLAASLVNIIKTRQKQINFQLIIITHDEEFVNMLGNENHIEFFYKISKSHDGKSRITKARIQELN